MERAKLRTSPPITGFAPLFQKWNKKIDFKYQSETNHKQSIKEQNEATSVRHRNYGTAAQGGKVCKQSQFGTVATHCAVQLCHLRH